MPKSDVLSNSSVIAVTTVLAKIASFFGIALVARSLSANEMGALDLGIFLFMSILPVAAFNLPVTSTVLISKSKKPIDLAFSVFVVLSVIYGIFSLLFLFLIPYISQLLSLGISSSIPLIILCSFLFVLYTFSISAFQGMQKFKYYAFFVALQPVIFLATQLSARLSPFFFSFFSSSADAVVRAYLFSYLLPALVAFLLLYQNKQIFNFSAAMNVIKYSIKRLWWPLILAAMVSFYMRSLIFINDPINNAILRILDQYGQLLIIPFSALLAVIFPKMAQQTSVKNHGSVQIWLRKFVATSLISGLCFSFIGIIILPIIFGAKYEIAIPFLGLYAGFLVISLLSGFITNLSLANTKWNYIWTNSGIFLNLVNLGLIVLFRKLGVLETIAIYAFDSLFLIGYFFYETRKELRLYILFLKNIISFVIATVAFFTMSLFVKEAFVIVPILIAITLSVMHITKFMTFKELYELIFAIILGPINKFKDAQKLMRLK